MINSELLKSEYVTVDEKGWHIADNAPEDLKKQFKAFMDKAKDGAEIIIKK